MYSKVFTVALTAIITYGILKLIPTRASLNNKAQSNKNPYVWKKLIVLGDSNVQFGFGDTISWLRLLQDKLQRQGDVVNRGFEGYNTRYMRLALPKIMSEFQLNEVAGAILMLGTNDALQPEVQHVDIGQFVVNYQWIIDYLYQFGLFSENLIIITPPKTIYEVIKPNSTEYTTIDYVRRVMDIATNNKISFIDLYGLMDRTSNNTRELLHDGIHINNLTSHILFNNLWPIVYEKFVRTKEFRVNFPDFRNIPYKDPSLKSLSQYE